MATSSEISWLWDYSTLVDNEIVCDICFAPYVISVDDEVKIHLHNQHKNVNVSSENLQENKDLQFYKIQNNSIRFTLCNNKIYTLKNTDYVIIIRHLEDKHGITKNLAEEIYKLLHGHYKLKSDESDRNEKQCCNICKIMIPNKLSFLINHFNEAHKRIIHPKITLSYIAENWVWNYFTRDEEIATCSLCNMPYKNYLTECHSNLYSHMQRKHKEDYDRVVSLKDKKLPYSKMPNNQVKCDICNKTYPIRFNRNSKLPLHLFKKHKLDVNKSNNLCNWQLNYFIKVNTQTSRCMLCLKIFRKMCSFNLIEHLIFRHNIEIPTEISSMRLLSISEHLLSSFKAAEVIATSSMHQQQTQNFDQISGSYNIYNQIAESTENRSTRYAVNNATSSSYQQPTQNFYQFSGSYNICDQIDESTENRLARYAENNATSSSYQQPTQNSDQISDSDNLYDLIDEYTENELIRYAENNVTSSNYQPPTQNIDQISDSADLFDVIAELTENRLPR